MLFCLLLTACTPTASYKTADMQAYKDLNKELTDPFPTNKVRGPESHPDRNYTDIHGHVGPVDHIPIR